MAVEIATAYVTLTTSAQGIEGSVAKQMGGVERQAAATGKKAGGRLSGGFKAGMVGLAGSMGALFAVGKVVSFFKDANAEARESQKVNALTAQVIKSTGAAAGITADQVGNLAGSLSAKTAIDDEVIQSGANLLLTFTNVRNEVGRGNDVFDQGVGLANDMSVALGQSMKSSAMQLGKALNDPVKGMTALSRVGVTFTEGQKKQVAAMVEAGDRLGAQKLIMKELRKEFGGAAEAAATPAQKLQVAWGNFKETIGTALLPVIDRFASFLTGTVVPALTGLFGWIKNNAGMLKVLGLALIPVVAAWVTYKTTMGTVNKVTGIFNTLMRANPVVLVVTGIMALIAALVLAYNKVGWFRDFVNAAFRIIKTVIVGAVNVIKAVFRALWTAAKAVWNGIKTAAVAVWNFIVGFIRAHINAVKAIVRGVGTAIGAVWRGIKSAAQATWSWIVSAVKKAGSVIKSVWKGVGSFFEGIWDGMVGVAKGVINGLIDGINWLIGGVNDFIRWYNRQDYLPGTLGEVGTIPRLAEGGLVDRATLAVIGEAGPEAIIPLDKLDGLSSRDVVVTINAAGLDRSLVQWLQHAVRVNGGGDVQLAFGGRS